MTGLEVWGLVVLTWLALGLSGLCGLAWWGLRRAVMPRPKVWEVMDISMGQGASEGQEGPRRLIREVVGPIVEPAPWEGQPQASTPGVSFPDSWAWEWPEAEPHPARLPDEEDEA